MRVTCPPPPATAVFRYPRLITHFYNVLSQSERWNVSCAIIWPSFTVSPNKLCAWRHNMPRPRQVLPWSAVNMKTVKDYNFPLNSLKDKQHEKISSLPRPLCSRPRPDARDRQTSNVRQMSDSIIALCPRLLGAGHNKLHYNMGRI